jgi:ribosomal protein S12 methylthiotransferase
VRRHQKARVGQSVRVMVDGPSPESALVLQGRLEGQAPDIDPVVYIEACDPGEVTPGQLISARITGAKDYDLIVEADAVG